MRIFYKHCWHIGGHICNLEKILISVFVKRQVMSKSKNYLSMTLSLEKLPSLGEKVISISTFLAFLSLFMT